MKQYIFAVFDSAAKRYIDPFVAPTAEFALRGFRQACNTDGHQFNLHAPDFTIFCIGEWDADNGIVTPVQPQNLGNALQFIEDLEGPVIPLTAEAADA